MLSNLDSFIIFLDVHAYLIIGDIMDEIKNRVIEKTSFMSEVTIEGYCDIELYENITKDAYTYKIGDLNITPLDISTIEIPLDI